MMHRRNKKFYTVELLVFSTKVFFEVNEYSDNGSDNWWKREYKNSYSLT